jgi:transcriptional regulator with XRE-family HTH domain
MASSEKTLGDRIRLARTMAGYSLRRLEQISGVSYNGIHNLERGIASTIHLDTALALADALNVSPCWLCFGEGRRVREPHGKARNPHT